MPKNSSSLYRKVALEHISTPEQLNQTIQVVPPRTWVLFLTICGLLILVLIWSFLGKIATRVKGEGILLAGESGLYNAVAPKGEGKITRITTQVGDLVKKDQIVAYLETPDLSNQIIITQQSLSVLQAKYKELQADSRVAIKERHEEILRQNQALEQVIKEQKDNLVHVADLLKVRQESFKKGLVTKQDVVSSWQDYYRTRKEIQIAQDQIVQNQIQENNFVDSWNERLRELDLKIKDKIYALNELTAQLQSSKYIQSPIDGNVISIRAQIGDIVKGGVPIVGIAPLKSSLDVVAYIPADVGKKVKKNMKALVTPSIIKKEEYGSIIGKVNFVAEFPSTVEGMNALLQNEALVKDLIERKLPIEVRIHLTPDTHTISGLKWTSSKGPPQKITPGTIVEANIIVREQPPVTLLIPALKKLIIGE